MRAELFQKSAFVASCAPQHKGIEKVILEKAKINANERLLDSLFPMKETAPLSDDAATRQERTRDKLRKKLYINLLNL